jgi:hypothetical protein
MERRNRARERRAIGRITAAFGEMRLREREEPFRWEPDEELELPSFAPSSQRAGTANVQAHL